MKKYIFSLSFLFFVITGIAQSTGSISGTVTDKETGKVISNAEILVLETAQGTAASEKGVFEIKNIKPGKYTLYSYVMGYVADTISNIKVEADKITQVAFSMKAGDIKLGEVTVAATKIHKTIDKIGSPVYIIDKMEIERTEGRNMEETLIRIPGVFTEDRYHNEMSVVSFRGVGLHSHVTRGILVLVDGVSLTEAMGRTDFEGVDLENAEKIEVLKGPVSALYGPNGITGVINVVEKTPKKGFHGKAKASYGSYNSMTLSGDVNGGTNGFRYMVKGKYFTNDGYLDRSGSTTSRIGLKLTQQFKNSGKLQFTSDYIDNDMDVPGTLSEEEYEEGSREGSNRFASLDKIFFRTNLVYTKNFGENIDMFTNAYFRKKESEGFYSDSNWSEDDINTFGGEIRSQWSHEVIGKKNSIIVGASLLNEKGLDETYRRDTETGEIGRQTSDGESSYNMTGIYFEDEFMLTDKLALTFGIRYDRVDYDWDDNLNEGERNTSSTNDVSSFSPKFGFAYNPTKNVTVFGNVARGFNPPQVSQLFVGSSYPSPTLPNPDLEPEYLTNYELGIRGDIHDKFIYQASLFKMDFTDQVSTEIIPEIDPETPVYQNIGETKHNGIETSIEYHFTKLFNVYANYSYLDARFDNNPEYGDNELRKTPNNTFNTGLRYGFKFGLTAALDFKFVDSYYMDNEEVNEYEGHSLVNMKLMYKWNNLNASLAVNNLFDTNYAAYANASEVYDRTTRQTYWEKRYIPGWPVNVNASISYKF
ncbi:MAG: TonB-dependent receptor [Bacteroidota bacterium]